MQNNTIHIYNKSFSPKQHSRKAIILGLSLTGLSIGRILGRRGIKVIGIDNKLYSPGLFSKYIKKIILANSDPELLINTLLKIANDRKNKPILFIDSDEYLIKIDRFRNLLNSYCEITSPPSKILNQLINKYELFKLCKMMDIMVPKTFLINSLDDLNLYKRDICYPIIIKPNLSLQQIQLKYKSRVIKNEIDLILYSNEALNQHIPILLQELIPGNDCQHYSLATYFSNDSHPLEMFTARKYLQSPKGVGIGVLMKEFRCDTIEDIGISFLKKINYIGFAELEFKKDDRDNRFKLIEINCRPWLQLELAKNCGVDFPFIAFNYLSYNTIDKLCKKNRKKAIWVYTLPLLTEIIKNSRYSEFFTLLRLNFLKCISTNKFTFAVLAFDDLKPFISELTQIFKKLFNKILFKKQNKRSLTK